MAEGAGRVAAHGWHAAGDVAAESVYITTGSRGALTWEEAAEALKEAAEPVVEHARRVPVPLLMETVPSLREDVGFNHTLADTVALSETAGFGVCIDTYSSWTERNLQSVLAEAIPRCALVQVSDYVIGDWCVPGRAVPGDGDIPLERILGWLQEAGYSGPYDLELIGPRIVNEGGKGATLRAIRWLSALLDKFDNQGQEL